jgi:hypothetical protein
MRELLILLIVLVGGVRRDAPLTVAPRTRFPGPVWWPGCQTLLLVRQKTLVLSWRRALRLRTHANAGPHQTVSTPAPKKTTLRAVIDVRKNHTGTPTQTNELDIADCGVTYFYVRGQRPQAGDLQVSCPQGLQERDCSKRSYQQRAARPPGTQPTHMRNSGEIQAGL